MPLVSRQLNVLLTLIGYEHVPELKSAQVVIGGQLEAMLHARGDLLALNQTLAHTNAAIVERNQRAAQLTTELATMREKTDSFVGRNQQLASALTQLSALATNDSVSAGVEHDNELPPSRAIDVSPWSARAGTTTARGKFKAKLRQERRRSSPL